MIQLLAILVWAYDGKPLWPWWTPKRRTEHGARLRGGMLLEEFEVGKLFWMSGREWMCTDVGTRAVCAVKYEDYLRACDSGPPYSVAESVIDEYDLEACSVSSRRAGPTDR